MAGADDAAAASPALARGHYGSGHVPPRAAVGYTHAVTSAVLPPPAGLRDRRWWASAVALGLAGGALCIALLVPRLFSDPFAVDPYVLRLSGVAAVLAAASLLSARLAPARPVLLAVAAMTVSFSVFSGGPQWIADITPRFDGNAQVLLASAAQALITIAVAVLGSLAFLVVVMLLPATLLGRDGLAPVAIARDLPLQGPADALQAFAQELQFRGMLLGALDRVLPPWAANLAQAAFFGLAHIAVPYQGPADAFVPVTIALGLVFGWITQRTGSLWPAIIIHAVALVAVTVGVLPGLYGY